MLALPRPVVDLAARGSCRTTRMRTEPYAEVVPCRSRSRAVRKPSPCTGNASRSEDADLSLNQARWSVWTYERYLQAMFGWAGELEVAADELEACIFSEQAGLVSSQWATSDQPLGRRPQAQAL